MAEKTDHDILLKLEADMCWLKKVMGNHLRHHWMITLAVAGAFVTGAVAFVVRSLI